MYVVRMCRAAVPHMKTRGGGSVLNITAISAIQPIAGFGLSVATWDAVIGYAKTLSLELAASASTSTPSAPVISIPNGCKRCLPPAARTPSRCATKLRARCRCGASERSSDIASLVAFLVSPRGNYITGTAIPVDGGLFRGLR